jgi:hypothetical protein
MNSPVASVPACRFRWTTSACAPRLHRPRGGDWRSACGQREYWPGSARDLRDVGTASYGWRLRQCPESRVERVPILRQPDLRLANVPGDLGRGSDARSLGGMPRSWIQSVLSPRWQNGNALPCLRTAFDRSLPEPSASRPSASTASPTTARATCAAPSNSGSKRALSPHRPARLLSTRPIPTAAGSRPPFRRHSSHPDRTSFALIRLATGTASDRRTRGRVPH